MPKSTVVVLPKQVKDIAGLKFGQLTVIEFSHVKRGAAYWKCACSCGGTSMAQGGALRAGGIKSCGCMGTRGKGKATLICSSCGDETKRFGPVQKYCLACSEKKDLIRKKLWVRKNPPSPKQAAKNYARMKRAKVESREAGAQTNKGSKRSIAWYESASPDLLWIVRVAIPFSYAVSKNHIYTWRSAGHVALRKEGLAKRAEIILMFRNALRDRRVAHNKVWIDMLVQKPNHRGDAVNVIDVVCDALQEAIGVNDRWFCIRRLDWEIVKDEPQLYIGIGQDSCEDCQVCSYCGQIKTLEAFNKSKHNNLGVGRECRQCLKEGRVRAREKRKA